MRKRPLPSGPLNILPLRPRPHPVRSGSSKRRPSPWYITEGERKDAAGHDEARR